jgi:hypothetical protein
MNALLALILTVSAPPGDPVQLDYLPIAVVESGKVYWHGHQLNPPFRLEVGFVASPDTLWRDVYINRLPLQVARRPSTQPVYPAIDTTVVASRNAMFRRVAQSVIAENGPQLPRDSLLRRMASLYSEERDLVDSASVEGKNTIVVHFRGAASPYIIECAPPSSRPASLPLALGYPAISEARRLATSLRAGRLLIVGRGVTSVPQAAQVAAEAEIATLRFGRPHVRQFIVLPEDILDFTAPRSIGAILAGEEE